MHLIVTEEHVRRSIWLRSLPNRDICGICPIALAARETFPGHNIQVACGKVFFYDTEHSTLQKVLRHNRGWQEDVFTEAKDRVPECIILPLRVELTPCS